MPSNTELKKWIAAAAKSLDEDAPGLKGKTNAEMADILKGIRIRVDAAKAEADRIAREELEAEAGTDSAAAAVLAKKQAEEVPPGVVKIPKYRIAPGKAITTKRGILGADGEEIIAIEPDDLAAGAAAIKAFVKSGHIIKK
ncbi:MAG: hypothetical protein GY811_05205 [Myxococcales bacterium]|nr:hypothetical protein [Myxococcales bacterium]